MNQNCIIPDLDRDDIDDKEKNVDVAQSVGINAFHLKREEGMSLYDFENYLINEMRD